MKRSLYADWTKEALLEHIHRLENSAASARRGRNSGTTKGEARQFNMDEYPRAKIALNVAYIGTGYHGFASQSSRHDQLLMDTVEDHVLAAIYRTRLAMPGDERLEWSRSGRTDAGVSGIGQVVAANLRTSSIKRSLAGNDDGTADAPSADTNTTNAHCMTVNNNGNEENWHDFARILNKQLPNDIRILGWCPVPSSFNARFDCRYRRYKYFFDPTGLDLDRMRMAAGRLVGEHDFRNFCRKDPSKPVSNYNRRILHVDISCADGGLAAFTITGTAFLYNQVRCTMAVLLMVGRGLEQPGIIDDLLDIEKHPKRPLYDIAAEWPLVLERVGYDPELEFRCDPKEALRIGRQLRETWARHMAMANIIQLVGNRACVERRGGEDAAKHVPLRQRATEK